MASLRLCDVITLNPPNLLCFILPPVLFLFRFFFSLQLSYSQSQPAQVNVAIYFDISRMNQPLKAVSVIKNTPEGAAMARVLPASVYVLQLALDYWDLLE